MYLVIASSSDVVIGLIFLLVSLVKLTGIQVFNFIQ